MKKGAIELSSRTLIILILFIVVAALVIGLGLLFGGASKIAIQNMTNVADVLVS